MRPLFLGSLTVLFSAALTAEAQAKDPPMVERFLVTGKLGDGEAALAAELKQNPKNDEARFSLGVVQVLRGAERVMQGLYRHGFRDDWNFLGPGLNLPVPKNPKPEPITYAKARAIIQAFHDDLQKAEATLGEVKDPAVKLPIHVGLIFLDFNGDGKAADEECFWRIYARLDPGAGVNEENAQKFVIAFDHGDVHWLRGYCHLLMALCEITLAHDHQELFDRTAHLFFTKPETPFAFLQEKTGVFDVGGRDIMDIIAFIHLLNFPVKEPKRMQKALEHLEAMVAQSRLSWKSIRAETDDDNEWLPNPKQTGVIPGVRINIQMLERWTTFLDEAEAILQGKKLIPFWRDAGGKGVNLRKVFTEPRSFDLVLWVQGSAAAPYLEKGELTAPNIWQDLLRVFGGNFIGFAIWFN